MPKRRQQDWTVAGERASLVVHSLTHGDRTVVIDRSDVELVRARRWYVSDNGHGGIYARTSDRRHLRLHQLLLPGVPLVDHVNRNPLDNRRANLRAATGSLNAYNKTCAAGRTGQRGVTLRRGRFEARIGHETRLVYLGRYASAAEAAAAYRAASVVLYGGAA
jgi:hypothetical protein